MAFGTIEIATVTRQQDYTAIKHQEDTKGIVNQIQLGEQAQKNEDKKAKNVNEADDANWNNARHDAREKGKNEYQGDGGRDKDGPKKKHERVVVKGRQGFDIKI